MGVKNFPDRLLAYTQRGKHIREATSPLHSAVIFETTEVQLQLHPQYTSPIIAIPVQTIATALPP